MTVSIRVASSPGEARIAVIDEDRLLDYALWRPGAPDGVGDVHRGRVIAHVPAIAGGFVALTDAEGFLPDSEGAKGLSAGTMLTVRVTRAAQGGKGPRLTARLDGPTAAGPIAAGPIALLRRGPDPVTRLAARYPRAPVLVDDAGLASALRGLGQRVSVAPRGAAILDDEVAEAIDALAQPIVELRGGARLSIWPTPALVAIDVDAAAALTGSGGPGARHEALNRVAVAAVGEQIRLRNLSGGIVVDLAGLSPRKRSVLAPDFVTALANDPLSPKFLGFTALGLAEIVRARVHPPLHELLAGPLPAGLSALRAVMAGFDQDPRALPAVRAHPGVVSALQADPAALADFARRTGRAVTLRSDPSLPATVWVLEKDNG
ncbi:ribonuclease E/G [Rhodopila sp.]|uniref:ribonuclease E/G n=1 Tax=Rhodopila sp. TaxID=2480087 RepID=UPI003D0EBEB1